MQIERVSISSADSPINTVLLCTNEGGGMGSSERDIKKYAPGADLKKGLSITGSQAANSTGSVQKWFSANGLI